MSNRPALFMSRLRAVMWFVSLSCLLFVSQAQPATSSHMGSWRGTITQSVQYGIAVDDQESASRTERQFRIDISDEWVASVYYRTRRDRRSSIDGQSSWRPMPLGWALNRVGDEGVVVYGHNATAAWMESHVFTIALIDHDRLLVQWWRVVNNLQLDPGEVPSKWAVGGHGEFTRVGRR